MKKYIVLLALIFIQGCSSGGGDGDGAPSLAVPDSVKAVAGNREITVTWADSSFAAVVEYSSDGSSYKIASSDGRSDASFNWRVIESLTNGTEYSIRLRERVINGDRSVQYSDYSIPVFATPSSRTAITSATTFDEYLAQLQTYNDRGLNTVSASEIAGYFSYNNQLSDFLNDSSVKSISNSMDGVYHNFVQPGEVNSIGQPYVDIWPSFPNGEFTLIPVNPSYSRITNARDLTNGLTLEGDFKLFFGVKETEFFGTSSQRVPILILLEGVVKSGGVPLARVLNSYESYLYESDIPSGPAYNGDPGHLFAGTYTQYVIEAFDNSVSTGFILAYEAYFIRQ